MFRLSLFLSLLVWLVTSALAQDSQEIRRAGDIPTTKAAESFFTGKVHQQRLFNCAIHKTTNGVNIDAICKVG